MRLALIGLGKMGGNMARRMRRSGLEVVGYDRNPEVVAGLADEVGMIAASSALDAVDKLTSPRVVWLMLPSGDPTEKQLQELAPKLSKGDIVVDGGNSNYKESQRRGAWLAEQGIGFMDAGTSGGVWGLENGYCLMVGATPEVAQTLGAGTQGAGTVGGSRLGTRRTDWGRALFQDDPQRHRIRNDAGPG